MPERGMKQAIHSENSAHGTDEAPRILVVDDEAAILFAYRRMAERNGYTVDTCETLAEAVEYIKTRRYLAIITDLRLTGTDTAEGFDVLACVRDHQPHARVIVITGYGEEQDTRAARALNAAFYFKKPLEPSVILEALRHIREDEMRRDTHE